MDTDKNLQSIIVRALEKSYLEELLLKNPLALKGKSDTEIKKMCVKHLRKLVSNTEIEISFTVDHTDSLLKSARFNFNSENKELSAFFYATYFEHKFNYFIHLCGKKKGLSSDSIKSIIRKTNLDDKCSWILELLGIKAVTSRHQLVIKSISEIRNKYVHYKWSPLNDDLGKNEKKEFEILEKAEATVKYLKLFEENAIFKNSRKKAFKAIKIL